MSSFRTLWYGPGVDQFAELWPPTAPATGPVPVVVLVHGGYWRQRYGLDLMHPLAADLSGRGYAVWNLEYRRIDGAGGWPATFLDIVSGIDRLADLAGAGLGVDLDRVAVVGHSAGGQLALWAGARRRPGRPDTPRYAGPDAHVARALTEPPRVVAGYVVSLAGVCDLVEAARQGLSGRAACRLLEGTAEQVPDRYRLACPTLLLPLRVPQLVVHGTADADVPLGLSAGYAAAAAAAGDPCEFRALPGVDHFALIDPASEAWAMVAGRLAAWRNGDLDAAGDGPREDPQDASRST